MSQIICKHQPQHNQNMFPTIFPYYDRFLGKNDQGTLNKNHVFESNLFKVPTKESTLLGFAQLLRSQENIPVKHIHTYSLKEGFLTLNNYNHHEKNNQGQSLPKIASQSPAPRQPDDLSHVEGGLATPQAIRMRRLLCRRETWCRNERLLIDSLLQVLNIVCMMLHITWVNGWLARGCTLFKLD